MLVRREKLPCAVALVALTLTGCSVAPHRHVLFRQMKNDKTHPGQFEVDTSALPPGAVTVRIRNNTDETNYTEYDIRPDCPVKILLVPADQPN